MDIQLELQPADAATLANIMGRSDVSKGDEVEIGDQMRLRYLGTVNPRGDIATIIISVAFALSTGISSSLFATALSNYLQDKQDKDITIRIRIDGGKKRRSIPINSLTPEDTVKVLEQIIKEKEKAEKE